MKKISVIIPTRNRQEFLKSVLEPFRSFTEDIEIFVIDDASSEAEASSNKNACNTIPNCQYVYFAKNKGAAVARNYGLEMSSAEVIWFVDDDDFVPVQAIKDVLEVVGNQPLSSQVILLPMRLMSNSSLIRKIVPSEERNNFSKYRDIGHQVTTSAAVFSRKTIQEVGGWDDSLVAGQDTDLFLRVSQITDFKCLATEPVIQNIGHVNRITRAVIKQEIGKVQFLRKHWKILTNRRKFYYLFSFLIVAPLLNSPSLYQLRIKLFKRHYN
jgi:glycosyltransferase involved in cell wall biosynthesis